MSDCYKCLHRGDIPGDRHSCCKHPVLGDNQDFFNLLDLVVTGKAKKAAGELNIRALSQGVRNGWFMWPANFDPIWLTNCDGFKEKESRQDEISSN